MASELPQSGEPSNIDQEEEEVNDEHQRTSHHLSQLQYSAQDAIEESSESEFEGMAGNHSHHQEVVDVQERRGHSEQQDTPSTHMLYSDSEDSSMDESDTSFLTARFGTSSVYEGSDSANIASTERQELACDDDDEEHGSHKRKPPLTLSEHKAAEARKQKKHNHNERIRRQDLKNAVIRLRNQLQKRRTKRPTTIKVLEAAIQEIKELKGIESEEERELEALKRKQNHLTWRLERLMCEHNVTSSTSSTPTIPTVIPRPSLHNPSLVVSPQFIPSPTAVPFSTGETRPFLQSPLLFNRVSPFPTSPVSLSSLQPGAAGPLYFHSAPRFPYSILPLITPSHIPSPPPHNTTNVRPLSPMNNLMQIYPPWMYPSTGLSRFTGPPHFAFPLGGLPQPLQLSSSGISNQPLVSCSSSSNLPTLPFHFSLSSTSSSSSCASQTSSSRRHEESRDLPGDRSRSRSTGEDEVSGSRSESETHQQHQTAEQRVLGNTQHEESGCPKNGVDSAEPTSSSQLQTAATVHTGSFQSFSTEESAAAQGSAEVDNKNEDVEIIVTEREEKLIQNLGPSSAHRRGIGTTTENSIGNYISVIHHGGGSHSSRKGKKSHRKATGLRKRPQKKTGPPPLVKIDSKRIPGGVEKPSGDGKASETLMTEILFKNGQHLPTPPLLKRDRGRLQVENQLSSYTVTCK